MPNQSAHIETIRAHLRTLPLCHTTLPLRSRAAAWLNGGGDTNPPLFLIHDLGALFTQPPERLKIAKPPHLPEDIDTSAYTAFLEQLSRHPLVRTASRWKLTDAVVSVIMARLPAGIAFPNVYGMPDGVRGVYLRQRLEKVLKNAPPAVIWQRTPATQRPELDNLLSQNAMTDIQKHMQQIDRDELRFLHHYGPGHADAPDAGDIQDLFALTDLPGGVRLAMANVLRLMPRVSSTAGAGGVQTYAMGGYDGLSRKGSLDSLLPSEFAYKKNMFAHRLLNREALFYGREGARERQKQLAYIITQAGIEIQGDNRVLSQGLTLALANAMQARGYEVRHSFIGSELTDPTGAQKTADMLKILYYRDQGALNASAMLAAIQSRLRRWLEQYTAMHLFWVLDQFFDADDLPEHENRFRQLRDMARHHAWFICMNTSEQASGNDIIPAARQFHQFHVIDADLLWQGGQTTHIPAIEKPEVKPPEPEQPEYFTNSIGMKFVYIQPGEFMMGSPENEPERYDNEIQHHVTLTQGFYMQTTSVTQQQWETVMGDNPSHFKDGGPDCPVENVSWYGAQNYIRKLNEKEERDQSNGYRLPTEAQWEYACRAGTEGPFFHGRCLSTDQANYNGNYPLEGCEKGEYRQKTVPVKSFESNAWWLYDMHGNVYVWCHDWYGDYPADAVVDPVGPETGSDRVLRGGSWSFSARSCRAANRYRFTPGSRYYGIGFRLVSPPGQL